MCRPVCVCVSCRFRLGEQVLYRTVLWVRMRVAGLASGVTGQRVHFLFDVCESNPDNCPFRGITNTRRRPDVPANTDRRSVVFCAVDTIEVSVIVYASSRCTAAAAQFNGNLFFVITVCQLIMFGLDYCIFYGTFGIIVSKMD